MSNGPYAGIKVVDLTRVLAGPYCTMMLADLGATVIKVEVPGTGDDSRHIGPFMNGKSAYFTSVNRGKHLISRRRRIVMSSTACCPRPTS